MAEVIRRVDVFGDPPQAVFTGVPIKPGVYYDFDFKAIRAQLESEAVQCFHRDVPEERNYHSPAYARAIFKEITGLHLAPSPRLGTSTFPHGELTDLTDHLTSPPLPRHRRRRYKNYNNITGIVAAQIGVAHEEHESLPPMVDSLIEAAEEVSPYGRVIFVPYLNWVSPGFRNESKENARLRDKAYAMGETIYDMTRGSNLLLNTVIDELPTMRSWSERRNAMAYTAFNALNEYETMRTIFEKIEGGPDTEEHYDRMYLQLDLDTKIGKNGLYVAREKLASKEAIFVNGTLHYTGGIMKKSPIELASDQDIDIGQRLLYFAEIMRRRMFDHLPPISHRGYIPDFGFATNLDTLAKLGWYEERDRQNESYFVGISAVEAWLRQMDIDVTNPYIPYPYSNGAVDLPYLDYDIAKTAEGLVYYAPPKDYLLESSIRGLEEMVKRWGPLVLINFDQGKDYASWSELKEAGPQQKKGVRNPTRNELIAFINAVFTGFKDRGGDDPLEDNHQGNIDLEMLLNGRVPLEAMNLQELAAILFPQFREPVELLGLRKKVFSWQLQEYAANQWRTENWPKEKWPKAA